MNELATITPHEMRPADTYRMSTDAAGLCREIVVATASTIQGRKFVSVEGWQAIALAHGCVAGSRDVEKIEGGVRAIGEVRRMSDGQLLATAEGFVGEDEATWFGGQSKGRTLPRRNDYAIRAMAQTRAISRACRSAFAHVVVMMKANLETTPAAEVPEGGFDRDTGEVIEATSGPAPRTKLDGLHTSKTALKNAIHAVTGKLAAATTLEQASTILKEAKPTIDQAKKDWPELIDGDPAIEEDTGLRGAVARRKAELTPAEESATYQLLTSTLLLCETPAEIQNWLTKHGEVVETLSDEEEAKFGKVFDAHEAQVAIDTTRTPVDAG